MPTEPPCPGVGWTLGEIEFRDRSVGEGERHSDAVVLEVAASTDQDPRRMTPLAEVVDPDLVDRTFDAAERDDPVGMTFVYEDCQVVLEPARVHVGARPQ